VLALQRVNGLLHRLGFAGQHRFLNTQVLRLNQATVGRDAVAGFEHDNITRDKLLRFDFLHPAIAAHMHMRHRHFFQGGHRALRAVFLGEAHDRVEQNNHQDRDCVSILRQRNGYTGGNDQYDHQDAGELLDEDFPGALRATVDQFVTAVGSQAILRLFTVQAAVFAGFQRFQHLASFKTIPLFHRSLFSAAAKDSMRRNVFLIQKTNTTCLLCWSR